MALIEPPPVQLLRAHIRAGTRWFIWRFTHEAPASDGWAAVADRAQFDAAETPVQRWWTDEHVQFQPWFTKDTAPTAFGPDIFAITRLSGLRLLAVRRIHRNIPGHLL
jgi:hypothetical protein